MIAAKAPPSLALPTSSPRSNSLEHDKRRAYCHYQQNERRGHENGEAKHDNIDECLNEAVGNPQADIKPGESGIQTSACGERGQGKRHDVEEGRLLHKIVVIVGLPPHLRGQLRVKL